MAEATETKIKKYVSDTSLNALVDKIKSEDAKVLTDAKKYVEEYSESLSSNYDSAGSSVTAETNAKNYAKDYVDTQLEDYYDKSETYGKSEVDETVTNIQTALNSKAASSTTLAGYGITNAYTKTEVEDYVTSQIGVFLNSLS